MKKILSNLALIDLTKFARETGIDCAGSHVQYDGRFKYNLVKTDGGKLLASVQLHKSSAPTHTKKRGGGSVNPKHYESPLMWLAAFIALSVARQSGHEAAILHRRYRPQFQR